MCKELNHCKVRQRIRHRVIKVSSVHFDITLQRGVPEERHERDVAQSIACPPLKRSVVGSILLSGPSCSLGYFPFQPVVHNWFIKGREKGLWKSAYKRSLAAYRKE